MLSEAGEKEIEKDKSKTTKTRTEKKIADLWIRIPEYAEDKNEFSRCHFVFLVYIHSLFR